MIPILVKLSAHILYTIVTDQTLYKNELKWNDKTKSKLSAIDMWINKYKILLDYICENSIIFLKRI